MLQFYEKKWKEQPALYKHSKSSYQMHRRHSQREIHFFKIKLEQKLHIKSLQRMVRNPDLIYSQLTEQEIHHAPYST